MTTEQWIRIIRDSPGLFGRDGKAVALTIMLLREYDGEGCGVPLGKIEGYLSMPKYKLFARQVYKELRRLEVELQKVIALQDEEAAHDEAKLHAGEGI